MADIQKILDRLVDLLFAGTPSEVVKTVLKTTIDQIEPSHKGWEQLYVDAFKTAVEVMKPQLQKYADQNDAIGLDEASLRKALQGDLSIHDLALSDLQSEEFVAKLADRLYELDAFYIGGSKLPEQDTRQLVDNLVKQYAKAQLASVIEGDTAAFQQALTREALKTNTQLTDLFNYLVQQFGVSANTQRHFEDIMERLPRKVVNEIIKAGLTFQPPAEPVRLPDGDQTPSSPWDTYPVFDIDNYLIPFVPFLKPDPSLDIVKEYKQGNIRIRRDHRPFILPDEFQELPLGIEIDLSRNDCCRLEDFTFLHDGGKDVLDVTIQHTTYADYLRSGELLDNVIPGNKKETFRERFATLLQGDGEGVDLIKFRLTNVCGVGIFVFSSDRYLIARKQSNSAIVYPGRLTFSSSGAIRWRWYPDPFVWAYQNCFERLRHEIKQQEFSILNFGFDTRRLYFNFCFIENSDATCEEICRHVPPGNEIETIPFWRLHTAIDFLLSHNWEPAAEVAYLTICARMFGGWGKVSQALLNQRDKWSRHFMCDEWDYRARRGGDLSVMSFRHAKSDPERFEEESEIFAQCVAEFVGPDVEGKRVADIGAGNGRITQHLVRYAASVICVDLIEEMLANNRKRLGVPLDVDSHIVKTGAHSCTVSYEEPQFAQDWEPKITLDAVICCQVLIHNIDDNLASLIDKLCNLAPTIFVCEDVSIAERKPSPYTRIITKSQLVEEFKQRGFDVEREDTKLLYTDEIAFIKFTHHMPEVIS